MSMSVGPATGDADVMVEINTTPLIDVMLVLLIMLIITIPIQTHAVKLDMPQPNSQPPAIPPEVVDIFVDIGGVILWNNNPIDDRSLQIYLRDIGKLDPEVQSEIHLKAHRLVEYGQVAHVLAAAQRLGVVKIGIVGNEEFM